MANNTNNVRIKIIAKLGDNAQLNQEEIYAVGNIEKLGAWDVEKAVKLKYVKSLGGYTAFRQVPVGTTIEFKLLNAKSWNNVEKGIFTEEIINHTVTVNENTVVIIDVYHWN